MAQLEQCTVGIDTGEDTPIYIALLVRAFSWRKDTVTSNKS